MKNVLWCLPFVIFSCNQQPIPIPNAELLEMRSAIEFNTHRLDILRYENDSLYDVVQQLQQDQRVDNYYIQKDFHTLASKMDSMARKKSTGEQVAKVIGSFAGGFSKRFLGL